MATPFGLVQTSPRSLSFMASIVAFCIAMTSIFTFLFFSFQESKRVLRYEFQLLLRGTGPLLQAGDLRGFSEKIPTEKSSYQFTVFNKITNISFSVGTPPKFAINQCIAEKYLQYDLTFCRPFLIPWQLVFLLLGTLILMFLLFAALITRFNRIIVHEFRELFKIASIPYDEELSLAKAWTTATKMASLFKKFQIDAIEGERNKATSEMASQVAHDIRSPLSALNMIAGTISEVPEEKRLLIKSAIQRINDIANDLLSRGRRPSLDEKNNGPTIKPFPALLSTEIENLVSEKRIQFRNKSIVEIVSDVGGSVGVFALLDLANFKRVLSNVINNSVEAFGNRPGRIRINVMNDEKCAVIVIEDNGPGIPAEVLEKLGQRGITWGKEGTSSGSGLGVYHAKKSIEAIGGTFVIDSKFGFGTSTTITLPRIKAPAWFAEKVIISARSRIVVIDDDQAIHRLWQSRFGNLCNPGFQIEMQYFTSPTSFIEWFNKESSSKNNDLFLVDYEFLNQSVFNGLKLIEQLKISSRSILVSSHYDEASVAEKCLELNIKQIPKGIAGFIPIEVSQFHETKLNSI